MKILVCEDHEPLRALVRATLGRDYDLVEVADGGKCVAACRTERPELILLDMVLPGRSGLDVLADLRADPAFADTPIVLLTAKAEESDRKAALEIGADRYMTKPFSPTELISVINELRAERGTNASGLGTEIGA